MEKKVNEIAKHEHELEVTLTYDEIKPEIEEAYNKERKKISIDGFRKGKAPLHVIKKMYGESIEFQAAESISNKKFWDIADSDGLKPISTPKLVDIDFVQGEKLSFKVLYEVKPELELKDYKDLEIEKPILKVRDEDVESEITRTLKAHVTYVDADVIEDNKFRFVANLQRVNDDGTPFEGSRTENLTVDLSEPSVNIDLQTNSKGKKVGEKFDFTFVDEHKHGEETHKEEYKYVIEVVKIEKIIYPELDEELVQKISNKKAKTIDEFKGQIKDSYEKYYESQSEQIFESTLLHEVVKNNDFTPPAGYVSFMLERLIEVEKENAKRSKQRLPDDATLKNSLAQRAEWTAKWQIVLENLARIENISVDDAELEKLAEEEASKTGISVQKLVKYYKDTNRKESLLEDKVIKFLIENTKVKEVDANKEKDSSEKKASKKSTKKEDKKD
ncbi:MAG: trigger factor [Bacteroidetes bacterium]|nr:trigger factor [Bacteroidota bacterium]MBU1114989.1 trigger factor [Bacteroidota bacterium]MBU1797519.1 trigger factor [Bacteroidota bacterium]